MEQVKELVYLGSMIHEQSYVCLQEMEIVIKIFREECKKELRERCPAFYHENSKRILKGASPPDAPFHGGC